MMCFSYTTSYAQDSTDPLQLSREYSAQKNYEKAIDILEKYKRDHPDDLNAIQLLASNYYWDGQIDRADSLYELSIRAHPQAKALLIDRARMLYELTRYKEAKVYLEKYLIDFPSNIEALEYLGFINYWWGEYPEALNYFDRILALFPDNPTALKMTATLQLLFRPYLISEHQYSSDSQPLESGISNITVGKYYSPLLNPGVRLSWLYFITNAVQQTPWLEVINKMDLFRNTTHIDATLGFLPNKLFQSNLTGILKIEQNITRELSITLAGESRPYFYTLSSLQEEVSFNTLNATVLWSAPSGLKVQAFGGKQFFNDGNDIDTYYLWGLSPYFGWESVYFNLGYSYNYINSSVDHFESERSLDDILSDYSPGELNGVYVPYFTPHDQNVHSIIGTATYFINKHFELQFKGNVAFYAYADIPYLYLNNDQNSDLFIDKGFSQQIKTPFELGINATYYINEKVSLKTGYLYVENFFYLNNVLNFNFSYIF